MLTPMEKLPILVALEKAVKDELKATRAECDEMLLDFYDCDGFERRALRINGEKVGDFAVTFNSEGFCIEDMEAFEEFALSYGMATVRKTIKPEMVESVIKYIENDFDPEVVSEIIQSEVVISPDWEKAMVNVGGVAMYFDSGLSVPGVVPRPKTVKGTRVTGCKPKDVMPRLNQIEGGAAALLLGGAA